MGVKEDEEVGRATAPILEVIALKLPWFGGYKLTHLADRLGRALVEADHRPLRIERFGIEVRHILHACDVLDVDLGNAPHVLAPGLQVVLGQTPPHRLARQAFMLGELVKLTEQQLQRPAAAALGRA